MAQMSMASIIEPYRKGTPFSDWIDRLEFCFTANNITADLKKAHFFTLSGPFVFAELKLLYPTGNLNDLSYEDMIKKLRTRLDKKPSGLVQRLRFSNRVQHPDESLEDYVLAVKLQAEFCSFDTFKDQAVRDRIISGITDTALQEKILNEEEDLSAEATEKIILTWQMAKSNAKSLGIGGKPETIASINPTNSPRGKVWQKLMNAYCNSQAANNFSTPNSSRGPVKSRLGYRQYGRGEIPKSHLNGSERLYERKKIDYSRLTCDFCGVKGHIKKKCFKLKNLKRDAVKFVDTYEKPGTSQSKSLNEIFSRMSTREDSEDEPDAGDVQYYNWKRAGNGTPFPNTD
ncbi:uncharacterized protein LOC131432863 isoform X1 [Malaya genurostris]|uniref:uncharacterized protein LOC131432863 isoform X1 n=1 Tax=Malaya genurostris TaxID=325434 RepID=UPI0026F39C97|nr:uncharacterized protein LOC131432863 isoform X1 [Malaya genurostris]